MENIGISRIIRSRRRTVALMITPDARLEVRAPLRASDAYIQQLVDERAGWISRKISQVRERPRPRPLEFVDGVKFFYLGLEYPLEIYDGKRIYVTEKLLFPRELLPQARQEMTFWYRQAAVKVMTERAEYYAPLMGVAYEALRLSRASSLWGACTPQKVVLLNWRLVMAPLAVLDYVVVHELAHLIVRNHSKCFWEKVGGFCPDYVHYRGWLKKNGNSLAF